MARSAIGGSRNSVNRDARKAFRIEGLKEIQENVSKVINSVTGREVKQVYYEAGAIARDEVRARAPYDPTREKGTHLRDAVFVDEGDPGKANVLVGVRYKTPGAPHAHLQEYGWANGQAQPYMRPGLVAAGPKASEHIKSGLLKVIEKATK